ncbi:MAG: 2-oxoisovalerate dehydrogenase [Betaproteobacteria bacterium]
MDEIRFVVEEAPEGGFTARAVGSDIFTEADDLPSLRVNARQAVRCHFGEGLPRLIRLHITREEVLSV